MNGIAGIGTGKRIRAQGAKHCLRHVFWFGVVGEDLNVVEFGVGGNGIGLLHELLKFKVQIISIVIVKRARTRHGSHCIHALQNFSDAA